MKQIDIFGNETEPPEKHIWRRKYKRMQEIYGITVGKTCKTCKHLCSYTQSTKWYKCELWIVSNSAATDIRLKDTACGKYEDKVNMEEHK